MIRSIAAAAAIACCLVGAADAKPKAPPRAPVPVPAPAPAPEPSFQPTAAAVKAHMTFLASDLLLGRAAGEPGYDIAANYVASQFAQWGLKPGGGDGSYFQKTPLIGFNAASEGSLALVPGKGKPQPLAFGVDYLPSANPTVADVKVDAPLVFVGFGVVAPERGRDDYAGLDVKGKIVVVLRGAPKSFQTEERAFFGNGRTKRIEAAKRGAVGMITVFTPTASRVLGFERQKLTWQSPGMSWRDATGAARFDGAAAVPIATLSMPGGAKLFAGAPATFDDVMKAAEAPAGDVPRFDLPVRLKASISSTIKDVASANVVGVIEGSDPVLKDEVVVLSAHLDHIGVSKGGENGDTINNGAMDNAAGISTMLEAARGFATAPTKPKRTLVFVALTAEERGLTGSDYFARTPSTPGKIVANVNLDMPILLYDFTDIVAFGAERSSIGPVVAEAAKGMGLALSPDPVPDEGLFTRSDHFSFVLTGVPSVFIKTGYANGGKEADDSFRGSRYHRPGDDLTQAINYDAGAKFAKVNYEIAKALANAPERPKWRDGDFFGTRFGK
ncbi:MAG: M20/M25/M40 family metallo-hydrolase [Alphaproteobacteria bacterium]|nr:M20/M25/M40 family metallo-hydrolase [Alphaproteobacteria bacterium]